MPIYINGHEHPNYDRGFGLTTATNVNQGKNALGEFVGQRVDRDQDKINGPQQSYLDAATRGSIFKEFEEFVVTAKSPDMKNSYWKTERMYPGNRTAKIDEIDPDGPPTMHEDYKASLVDCGVMK